METKLDRDEILKAVSQMEPKAGEYEGMIAKKSVLYGCGAGILLCIVLSLVDLYCAQKVDFGRFAVVFAAYAVSELFEGIKRKKKSKFLLGVVSSLLTLGCIIMYAGVLLA